MRADQPATSSEERGLERLRPGRRSPADLREALRLGAKDGLHATAVMTVFRMPVSESAPPPSYLLAKVFGGDPRDYPASGLLLHFAYGAVAGALFGPTRPSGDSDYERERGGVALGTVYGLALSVFGAQVLLEGLLDMDLDSDERFVFHLSHLVYGLTLGAALGSDLGGE